MVWFVAARDCKVTVWRLKQYQVKLSLSSFVSRGGCKGLQWCGFAWFSVQFCGNFFLSCGIAFYKPKRTVVFRNFRVISIRFVASLCYSVRCLYMYVFQCSFTNRKSKKFDKNHLNDRPKRFGFFCYFWSCLIADLNQTKFSFDKDRLNHNITLHQAELKFIFFYRSRPATF